MVDTIGRTRCIWKDIFSFYVGYLTTLSVIRLHSVKYSLINMCETVGGMRTGRGTEVLGERAPHHHFITTNPT
jgi:hypothetical protein